MTDTNQERELLSGFRRLPEPKRRLVLDVVHSMESGEPPGVAGSTLLRFAGAISPADISLMKQAIEEGCERIDADGW